MRTPRMFTMAALACLGTLANAAAESGPKNVILLVGDGMGFAQVESAGLYFYGRPDGQPYWEFQTLAMTTYSASGHGFDPEKVAADFKYVLGGAADSGATATTLSTGVKTLDKRIGVDADGKPLRHLYEDGKSMGKSAGILSTVYLSHATPAAFCTHGETRNDIKGLAQDMINSTAVDVLIATGHPWFDDDGKQVGGLGEDPYKTEGNYDRVGGEELWRAIREGRVGGDANGDGTPDPWRLVEDLAGFQALAKDGGEGGRILGIVPVGATLQANRSGDKQAGPYEVPFTPNLPDMAMLVQGALNVLSRNPEGFFLMAEGGAIDWAGHANAFGRLIEEQRDFDLAIDAIIDWVEKNSSWDETLLIITADHETGYLCGPGSDPEVKPLENKGKGTAPGHSWHTGGHTNQTVPLFAKGSGAEKLLDAIKGTDPHRGPYVDNSDVPKVIRSVWR